MTPRSAFILVLLLLVIFYAAALSAVLTKSPTADEPMHTLSAIVQTQHQDFRVATDVPPFWHYVVSLPHWFHETVLPRDENWEKLIRGPYGLWTWAQDTLYRTPGNDADRLINRSRAATLMFGVGLGAMLAWWSFKLAGPWAAVLTAGFYCFDPNFIGHAGLVKNDVPLTFTWCWVMLATWYAGRGVTWKNLTMLGLGCGAAIGTKMSGVVTVPLVAFLLILRALQPGTWEILGRPIQSRGRKIICASAVTIAVGVIVWAEIWATYGFRFSMAPPGEVVIDDAEIFRYWALRDAQDIAGKPSPGVVINNWKPPLSARVTLFLQDHRLLPQGWTKGFLETQAMNSARRSFLMGEIKTGSWWFYFPLAMLFKSPIGLLMAVAFSAVGLMVTRSGISKDFLTRNLSLRWAGLCLFVPFGIYLLGAITADLNLGIRHVFPLYVTLFVLVGVAGAHVISGFGRRAGVLFLLLLAGVAAETARAYPDYIAFFNTLAGGSRGGLYLLGDSNLDWGQDLRTLGEWRKDHPEGQLYLTNWTVAETSYYGAAGIAITGSGELSGAITPLEQITEPGYIAIFANTLQGTFLTDDDANKLNLFRNTEPVAILGGTVYVYKFGSP